MTTHSDNDDSSPQHIDKDDDGLEEWVGAQDTREVWLKQHV